MKKISKWLGMPIILLIVLICAPSLVHAQYPGCPDPTVPCPIDGGLSFLIAAGVGYGIKKVRDSRKQQQAEDKL